MSLAPASPYNNNPSCQYYRHERDELIAAESTDSECIIDQQVIRTQSDVPEFYSRRPNGIPSEYQYNPQIQQQSPQDRQPYTYPQQFYYDADQYNLERNPQNNMAYDALASTGACYSTKQPLQVQDEYDAITFRSLPQVCSNQIYNRNQHQRTYVNKLKQVNYEKQTSKNGKRPPIAVQMPRYIRRPTSVTPKRPSAICLPFTVQPDPAVIPPHRRITRKSMVDHHALSNFKNPPQNFKANFSAGEEFRKKCATHEDVQPHKINSEGDVDVDFKCFEDVLSNLEENPEVMCNNSNISHIVSYLKPRMGPSARLRQEKMKQRSPVTTKHHEEECPVTEFREKNKANVDLQQAAADSLEKLLNQLKKCENVCSDDKLQTSVNDIIKETIEAADLKESCDDVNEEGNENFEIETKKEGSIHENKASQQSFNYQDISKNMLRSKLESVNCDSMNDVGSREELKHQSSTSTCTNYLGKLNESRSVVKPILDDACAIELHQSKSYIINLIDRALSKELGTVPAKFNRKEFNTMNPKKAIDTMNRFCSNCKDDKNFCLEITTALTDSVISNATAPEKCGTSNSVKSCCCQAEPTYIKQIKQLRWGHLKHIQHEVKRLEDLERFLDSYSSQSE